MMRPLTRARRHVSATLSGTLRAALLFTVILAWRPVPAAQAQEPSGAQSSTAQADSVDARASWNRVRRLADERRFEEARAEVNQALKRHPDNVELLWLRAGVAGWSGDHELAVVLYEGLISDHPDMASKVRVDLAQERLRAGDRQGALRDLDAQLAEFPGDPAAERLRAEIVHPPPRPIGRPRVETGLIWRDDSDDGQFFTTAATYYLPRSSRDVLLFYLAWDDVHGPEGDHEFARIGAGYERDWSDQWASHVLVTIATENSGAVPRVLGDAFVVYRPHRRLRFDLGIARRTIESARAMSLGIHEWTFAWGVDWSWAPRWELRASQRIRFYSDENRVFSEAAEARYTFYESARSRYVAFGRFEVLNSIETLDNGYYDPEGYYEVGPGIEARWLPGEWVVVDLRVQAGIQHEADASSDPFASINAGVEIPLNASYVLGVRTFGGDSTLGSDTGYSQRGWSVLLRTGR